MNKPESLIELRGKILARTDSRYDNQMVELLNILIQHHGGGIWRRGEALNTRHGAAQPSDIPVITWEKVVTTEPGERGAGNATVAQETGAARTKHEPEPVSIEEGARKVSQSEPGINYNAGELIELGWSFAEAWGLKYVD